MQFVKATNFKFQDREIYFGRRTFTDELGEKIVKGSGSYSDGAFWWKGLNEPPVMERFFSELEILDESPPASAEEEAARMYPYPKTLTVADWRVDEIIDRERQAHIRCAGMYTGEVERLKNEVARLETENKALMKEIQNWKDELKDQAREYRNNR